MSEDRTLTFTHREGYEQLPARLRPGELPDEARTAIWNELYAYMKSSTFTHGWTNIVDEWERILRDVYVYHDNERLDMWSTEIRRVTSWMWSRLEQEPLNRVFDRIEFIMRHRYCPSEFINRVSSVFHRFQLAYVIDPGPPATILGADTVAEGNELRRNLAELRTAGLQGCAAHLRNASKCINDGDAAGGVRESIHAVESVAKKIVPNANTLAKALSALEKRGVLQHKALKEALGRLYGYTSDEQGIRHALLDKTEADVTIDEAVFMLGACASFASYLWRKHQAAAAS